MCLTVVCKKSETTPYSYCYYLPSDIDPEKDVALFFCKKNRTIFGAQSHTHHTANGCEVLLLPNIVRLPNSERENNLLEIHAQSDAIIFYYTATDGTQKEFRFPLTGFCENYLMQFVK